MNSKQIAQLIGRKRWLRKLGYFFIYMTTLREWHIRQAIKWIMTKIGGDASWLDVGFGMGQHIYYIARKKPMAKVFGIEQDREQVDDFRIFIHGEGFDNIELYAGDFLESALNHKVDAVVCCSVLEHIEKDMDALRILAEHLKPNGYLLIYTPSAERRILKSTARKIAWITKKQGAELPHGHVRYYQPSDLVSRLSQVGFTIIKQKVTYGPAGQLAYDVVTLVQYNKNFLYLFPLYFLLVHPWVLLLMMIDYLTTHKTGNGFLCLAQKAV